MLYKITLTTGKEIFLRECKMSDFRIASKEASDNPQLLTDEILKLIIEKIIEKGQSLDIGIKPIKLDNFLNMQEYLELVQACNEQGVIADLKKTAKVEKVTQE